MHHFIENNPKILFSFFSYLHIVKHDPTCLIMKFVHRCLWKPHLTLRHCTVQQAGPKVGPGQHPVVKTVFTVDNVYEYSCTYIKFTYVQLCSTHTYTVYNMCIVLQIHNYTNLNFTQHMRLQPCISCPSSCSLLRLLQVFCKHSGFLGGQHLRAISTSESLIWFPTKNKLSWMFHSYCKKN